MGPRTAHRMRLPRRPALGPLCTRAATADASALAYTCRVRRLVIAVGLGAAFAPVTADAAPIELQRRLDGFWLFDDVDGSVENAYWFDRDPFLEGYAQIEAGFLAEHPDDSQFLVIYTTWSLPAGIGALYQAVANDVEGIGYAHIADLDPVIPAPIFDDTPGSQVQGFLHLNRWTQYLGGDSRLDDATISLIFGQEFGHAWLAFPHYVDELGMTRDDLLGRSDAHWSFYLDSAGSPVEGHAWTDNGDGTFTADKTSLFEFSDLDLYLMGLIGPEDVAPFFLLTDPTNCVDSAADDGSCAPTDAFRFEADSYTVTANRQDITIEQVIAAEGPRIPAVGDAPTEWDVSFLLLKRPDETLTEAELDSMAAIVDRSIELFDAQTRGLGRIVNRTAGEPDPPPPPPATDDGGTVDESGDGGQAATGAGTASTDGGTTDGTDGGSAAADGGDGGGGCGCRSSRAPAPTFAFGLVVLLAVRRRLSSRLP